jgi:hypothetical protein
MVTKRPALGRRPVRQLLQALVLGLTLMPSVADANAVTDRGAIANDFAFIHAARPAPPIIIELAYVHLAVYDAVNAIDGRYSVFAVKPSTSPRGASEEAATAAAAYTVLKWPQHSEGKSVSVILAARDLDIRQSVAGLSGPSAFADHQLCFQAARPQHR